MNNHWPRMATHKSTQQNFAYTHTTYSFRVMCTRRRTSFILFTYKSNVKSIIEPRNTHTKREEECHRKHLINVRRILSGMFRAVQRSQQHKARMCVYMYVYLWADFFSLFYCCSILVVYTCIEKGEAAAAWVSSCSIE